MASANKLMPCNEGSWKIYAVFYEWAVFKSIGRRLCGVPLLLTSFHHQCCKVGLELKGLRFGIELIY